jgi:hypothetical protein
LQSRRFWVLGCSILTAEHATTIHLLGILVGKCHILSLCLGDHLWMDELWFASGASVPQSITLWAEGRI